MGVLDVYNSLYMIIFLMIWMLFNIASLSVLSCDNWNFSKWWIFNLTVDSFSNHAMGSNCLWSPGSCCCACYFSCLVSCPLYTFGSLHVVGWDDFWLWSGVPHNYGRNNHRNGPTIFDWTAFPWAYPCKTSTSFRLILNSYFGNLIFIPAVYDLFFSWMDSNG